MSRPPTSNFGGNVPSPPKSPPKGYINVVLYYNRRSSIPPCPQLLLDWRRLFSADRRTEMLIIEDCGQLRDEEMPKVQPIGTPLVSAAAANQIQ